MGWMQGWPECTGWTYRHSEGMGRMHGVDTWTARVQGGTQGHLGCMGRTRGHIEPARHGHTDTEGAGCRQTDGWMPSTDSVAKSLAVSRFFLTATIIQRWQKR